MTDIAFNFLGKNPWGLADAGSASSLAVGDLDKDGDADLLIAAQGSLLRYFRNDGTASQPSFSTGLSNPFGLSAGNGRSSRPALVDIDGDGDLDAFVPYDTFVMYGANVPNLQFFRNTGTATAPSFVSEGNNGFGLGGVGEAQAVVFGDLDGDGDLDALIGTYSGETTFFQNIGSRTEPSFTKQGTTLFPEMNNRLVPALIDVDGDGDLDALFNDRNDGVHFFRNTGTAAAPAFTSEPATDLGLTNVSGFASLTTADIDGDGDLDALFGTLDGDTLVYKNGPDGPAVPTVSLAPASNSGSLGDLITNDATPTLTGTAGAGAVVTLWEGSSSRGTGTADGSGAWSITTSSLSDAQHTLFATAQDTSGSTSAASATLTLTIDTVTPQPTGLALAPASNSGSLGDLITNDATPTLTGTAEAGAVVTLWEGTSSRGTGTADGSGAWSITTSSLSDDEHTLFTTAQDSAGNTAAASATLTLTIDTVGPALIASSPSDNAMGASNTADLALTFSETVMGSGGVISLKRVGNDSLVESFFATNGSGVTISGSAVTINPAADLDYSAAYYLEIEEAAIHDVAGNPYMGLSGSTQLNFTTITAPPPPPPSTDGTSSTVDGVTVGKSSTSNSDGSTSTTLTIPVVTSARSDSVGGNGVADIPLVSSGGASLLTAQVPTGYGLTVSGSAAPKAAGSSLADLVREIQAHTTAGSAEQAQLTGGGGGFLGGLSANTPLLVQTVVPTVAPGSTNAPGTPLVISGTPAGAGGPQTALVIDTRGLPTGSAIQLQNVDFAAVIGAVTVTGGDGSQTVWGDSANQTIILGADDDTLHGGGGDDFVGSKTGNDVLFGDDGTDTVQGGEEHDRLFGNTGSDLLFGNTGADTLFGGQGTDLLHGGQDDDRLSGDLGSDTLTGDQGNDVLIGGLSDASMADASGDLLFGNRGLDVLFGNAGADTLHGGQEADTLYGGRDDDLLFGDAGDDVLFGDVGADTLSGGAGADLFVFSAASGRDEIADFQTGEGDRIRLAEGQSYNLRSDAAGNAVIVFSSDDEVVLRGIRREDVQIGWFVAG